MKLQKILAVLILLMMTFSSMAFAAPAGYADVIKANLKNTSLTTQEVVDLALAAGATLEEIYAAVGEFTAAEGLSDAAGNALVAEITAAAFVAATPTRPGATTPVSMQQVMAAAIAAQVPMTTIVESGLRSNVSLTVIMLAAPPADKAQVASAAMTLVNAPPASLNLILSAQDVAIALAATGTTEAGLEAALTAAGASPDEISSLDILSVFGAAAAEQTAATALDANLTTGVPPVARPEPPTQDGAPTPVSETTPPNDCDRSVPSPSC